jgi:hypothetical protein
MYTAVVVVVAAVVKNYYNQTQRERESPFSTVDVPYGKEGSNVPTSYRDKRQDTQKRKKTRNRK